MAEHNRRFGRLTRWIDPDRSKVISRHNRLNIHLPKEFRHVRPPLHVVGCFPVVKWFARWHLNGDGSGRKGRCERRRPGCQRQGEGAPGTFDFLGFTHYCGRSRTGKFRLKRKTAKKKYQGKVRDLKHWLRRNLTTPLSEVWTKLNAKLRGHYQYYGINNNWSWLMKFSHAAKQLAFRWLNRRSQSKSKTWAQFDAYMAHFPLASPPRLTDLIAMAARQ